MSKVNSGTDKDARDFTSLKKGEYVFREGDPARDLYIIQSGQVELLSSAGRRKERLVLLDAGDFFGETALLENATREVGARALSVCRLLKLDGATFGSLVRSCPEIASEMVCKLSRRLLDSQRARLAGNLAPDSKRVGASAPGAEPQNAPATVVRQLPAIRPRLMHSSGKEFALPTVAEADVGRADPRTLPPDIDLSCVDEQRTLSRRHARIVVREDGFYVCEQDRVANGTFVNGKRLKAGTPAKIQDGDEVRFGLVKTVFHTG